MQSKNLSIQNQGLEESNLDGLSYRSDFKGVSPPQSARRKPLSGPQLQILGYHQ